MRMEVCRSCIPFMARPLLLHIRYSILRLSSSGGKDLEEIELTHLDGHKGSKPVRIGNGAADHVQLDIYGELYVFSYLKPAFS